MATFIKRFWQSKPVWFYFLLGGVVVSGLWMVLIKTGEAEALKGSIRLDDLLEFEGVFRSQDGDLIDGTHDATIFLYEDDHEIWRSNKIILTFKDGQFRTYLDISHIKGKLSIKPDHIYRVGVKVPGYEEVRFPLADASVAEIAQTVPDRSITSEKMSPTYGILTLPASQSVRTFGKSRAVNIPNGSVDIAGTGPSVILLWLNAKIESHKDEQVSVHLFSDQENSQGVDSVHKGVGLFPHVLTTSVPIMEEGDWKVRVSVKVSSESDQKVTIWPTSTLTWLVFGQKSR